MKPHLHYETFGFKYFYLTLHYKTYFITLFPWIYKAIIMPTAVLKCIMALKRNFDPLMLCIWFFAQPRSSSKSCSGALTTKTRRLASKTSSVRRALSPTPPRLRRPLTETDLPPSRPTSSTWIALGGAPLRSFKRRASKRRSRMRRSRQQRVSSRT